LVVQISYAENIQILNGALSKDHVHIHVEYPPYLSISELVKKLKGRTSRLLQQEFSSLGKQYWERHFWAVGSVGWGTGNITDAMVQENIEHHRDKPNVQSGNWILE
jgi:putative transposase